MTWTLQTLDIKKRGLSAPRDWRCVSVSTFILSMSTRPEHFIASRVMWIHSRTAHKGLKSRREGKGWDKRGRDKEQAEFARRGAVTNRGKFWGDLGLGIGPGFLPFCKREVHALLCDPLRQEPFFN